MTIHSSDFTDIINDHMDAQPWKIECNECGEELNFSAKIDNQYDLILKVDLCTNCMKEG